MKIRNYKLLMLVPAMLVLFAIGVLVSGYMQNGEWFRRSIELRGGTLLTAVTGTPADADAVSKSLSQLFGSVSVKQTRGSSGSGLIIEAEAGVDPDSIIKALADIGITVKDHSSQSIGPALGGSFWSQAQLAIIFAFVMMGIIVFAIYRIPVPSAFVIACALSDILVTLAVMQLLGIELSLASLAALMMMIGYSVDTDILLTTRVLKSSEEFVSRFTSSVKTGLTMSLTTIVAMVVMIVSNISPVISQIASVLLIGISADICITWMQNAVVLRWYCERKGMK